MTTWIVIYTLTQIIPGWHVSWSMKECRERAAVWNNILHKPDEPIIAFKCEYRFRKPQIKENKTS